MWMHSMGEGKSAVCWRRACQPLYDRADTQGCQRYWWHSWSKLWVQTSEKTVHYRIQFTSKYHLTSKYLHEDISLPCNLFSHVMIYYIWLYLCSDFKYILLLDTFWSCYFSLIPLKKKLIYNLKEIHTEKQSYRWGYWPSSERQSGNQGLWSCLEEVGASCSPFGPCSCRLVELSTTALEVSGQADGMHPRPDCFQPARQAQQHYNHWVHNWSYVIAKKEL